MIPKPLHALLRLASSTALLLAPTVADATTKESCISAFDAGQSARRRGALRVAREELLSCSQQECPALVRADCADLLRRVEAAQPTIVLRAVNGAGEDLTD